MSKQDTILINALKTAKGCCGDQKGCKNCSISGVCNTFEEMTGIPFMKIKEKLEDGRKEKKQIL